MLASQPRLGRASCLSSSGVQRGRLSPIFDLTPRNPSGISLRQTSETENRARTKIGTGPRRVELSKCQKHFSEAAESCVLSRKDEKIARGDQLLICLHRAVNFSKFSMRIRRKTASGSPCFAAERLLRSSRWRCSGWGYRFAVFSGDYSLPNRLWALCK